jgi:hypothetical protein
VFPEYLPPLPPSNEASKTISEIKKHTAALQKKKDKQQLTFVKLQRKLPDS